MRRRKTGKMHLISIRQRLSIWAFFIKVSQSHPTLDEKHNPTLKNTYKQKLEEAIKRAEEIK